VPYQTPVSRRLSHLKNAGWEGEFAMKISLSDIVVAIVLSTSLSLVVIPTAQPFPRQGQTIGADAAAMVSLTRAVWLTGLACRNKVH
jgi:hypothetical protein